MTTAGFKQRVNDAESGALLKRVMTGKRAAYIL